MIIQRLNSMLNWRNNQYQKDYSGCAMYNNNEWMVHKRINMGLWIGGWYLNKCHLCTTFTPFQHRKDRCPWLLVLRGNDITYCMVLP